MAPFVRTWRGVPCSMTKTESTWFCLPCRLMIWHRAHKRLKNADVFICLLKTAMTTRWRQVADRSKGDAAFCQITSDMCVWCVLSVQSSYSSETKDDIHGTVYNSDGKIVQHLFGKWSEGIYYGGTCSARCVWRPGETWLVCESVWRNGRIFKFITF